MSSLIKLPVILAVAISLHVAHTTPSKSSSNEEATVNTALEWVVQFGISIIKFVKGLFWAVAAAEMAAIMSTTLLSSYVDPRIAFALIKNGDPEALHLTPLSTVGAVLVVGGTLLRWQCYRAMKSLFTFEVSIRKDHHLITTGPYAMVRHPSYSGMLAIHIGMYCWWGSRGSWLREAGFLDTTGGKIALVAFAMYEMGVLGGLLMRAPVEDVMLKKQFGAQWTAYAHRVPYALVPGVY
ncbi:putative class VI-like SAM-binding methyltransferase superfamily, isoprenylcysteine carboxyl methyltransferase family protein [Lyophyllum shimeji]|uniref:Protein-S-isoprenylcysteine O-methyltransferase n=1 Tax=Lyophyllum shimeji TaxID=47721 RepID=A0A9P3PWJ4_LYOSH|nr:putative class VI-like SAM-binding methyltransferase superfamily, isoprenylcysteine carboxyl methyltransferase family protein [Lyophyllum shimeji]